MTTQFSFHVPRAHQAKTPGVCIAFDLDDTLYLERDYVRSGFAAVGAWAAERFGLSRLGDRAWQLFESGRRASVLQTALADAGRPPDDEIVASMLAIYRTHRPAIRLLPDAADCLGALREKAVLGIITDGRPESQHNKCESLGLDKLVDFIVCTAEWGEGWAKPDPRGFQLAAALAGTVRAFVYVADNPLKDFQAPLALGWDTVRVRRRQGLYRHLESSAGAAPRIEVPDLSRLAEVLAPLIYRSGAGTICG